MIHISFGWPLNDSAYWIGLSAGILGSIVWTLIHRRYGSQP